jgi:photosystem II stability/assembly factor-like uncharacterized protein
MKLRNNPSVRYSQAVRLYTTGRARYLAILLSGDQTMLIATQKSVFELSGNKPELCFEGESILGIATNGSLSVVVSQTGLTVSDGTTSIAEVAAPDGVESVAILDDRTVLLGTEGPHIFMWSGQDLSQVAGFEALECREDFYTPWGGPAAVRSFAHTSDGSVYAAIHVGSIMRSHDRGQTWEPVTPDLHEDVHQVVTHPQHPDAVFANTADAVYISEDRGASWSHRAEGLPYHYGRAIAVHPEDGDCLVCSVSRGPHTNVGGRLYRSEDRGESWEHVTKGFPGEISSNIDTFQIAFSDDGRAWAAVDQNLYVSDDRAKTWSVFWTADAPIKMIAN